MTRDEARSLIGNAVVYHARHGRSHQGVITGVNDYYVFVRYGADIHSKATLARELHALAGPVAPDEIRSVAGAAHDEEAGE